MSADLMWVEASRDHDAELAERRIAAARVRATQIWPFLAGAATTEEYAARKSLAESSIRRAAADVVGEDSPELSGLVQSVTDTFDTDWDALHTEQVAAKLAAGLRKRAEHEHSLSELEAMPTLHQGHTDDLKHDDGQTRVWLSRMTREDGQPYDNQVTVERLDPQHGWQTHHQYQALGSRHIAYSAPDGTTDTCGTCGKPIQSMDYAWYHMAKDFPNGEDHNAHPNPHRESVRHTAGPKFKGDEYYVGIVGRGGSPTESQPCQRCGRKVDNQEAYVTAYKDGQTQKVLCRPCGNDVEKTGSRHTAASPSRAAGESVEVSSLPECDICKHNEGKPGVPALYDGATSFGPWANMCERHFQNHGVGLGTGKGQRLVVRQSSAKTATGPEVIQSNTGPEYTEPYERGFQRGWQHKLQGADAEFAWPRDADRYMREPEVEGYLDAYQSAEPGAKHARRTAGMHRLAEEHGGYHLEQGDGGWYVVNHIGERKNKEAKSHDDALAYQRALMVNVPGAKEDADRHERNGDQPKHSLLWSEALWTRADFGDVAPSMGDAEFALDGSTIDPAPDVVPPDPADNTDWDTVQETVTSALRALSAEEGMDFGEEEVWDSSDATPFGDGGLAPAQGAAPRDPGRGGPVVDAIHDFQQAAQTTCAVCGDKRNPLGPGLKHQHAEKDLDHQFVAQGAARRTGYSTPDGTNLVCNRCDLPVEVAPDGKLVHPDYTQYDPATWDDHKPEVNEGTGWPQAASRLACRKCVAGHDPAGGRCDYCDGQGSLDLTLAMVKAADGWDQGLSVEAFKATAADSLHGQPVTVKNWNGAEAQGVVTEDPASGMGGGDWVEFTPHGESQGYPVRRDQVVPAHTAAGGGWGAAMQTLKSLHGRNAMVSYNDRTGKRNISGPVQIGTDGAITVNGQQINPAFVISAQALQDDTNAPSGQGGDSVRRPGFFDYLVHGYPSGAFASQHTGVGGYDLPGTMNPQGLPGLMNQENDLGQLMGQDAPGVPSAQPVAPAPPIPPQTVAAPAVLPQGMTQAPGQMPMAPPPAPAGASAPQPTQPVQTPPGGTGNTARLLTAREEFMAPPSSDTEAFQTKVKEIAEEVSQANPDLDTEAALAIAREAVRRFPETIGA